MAKTLLDKAMEHKVARKRSSKVTQEDIEVAFAWLKDKINLEQVNAAYGKSMQYKIASIIKEAYNRGQIDLNPGMKVE